MPSAEDADHSSELPQDFLAHARSLEALYLAGDDPIRQSGFGGGAERWRRERGAILDAIATDGDIIDVGCANGYLAACLIEWAVERGIKLTPHGVDLGPRLIALARARLPQFAANFHCANAWDWTPPRQYRYVYALHDSAPPELQCEYAERLLSRYVAPGGRLIMGAYGSNSRQTPAFDIAAALRECGHALAGNTERVIEYDDGRAPLPIVRYAWIER